MGRRSKFVPLGERNELNVPTVLRCEVCGSEGRGTLPALDRAGWDWFHGLLPSRVAICPDCRRARHAERTALMSKAGVY